MLHRKPKVKEKKLEDLLNEAVASELQASIQYMWQHILMVGKEAASLSPIFKKIAIEEMKHAEMIAERLNYLGGEPTTKVAPINVGHTLEEMLRINAKEEEAAIALYKEVITKVEETKDYTTKTLFEKILADEEKHHDQFTRFLEK